MHAVIVTKESFLEEVKEHELVHFMDNRDVTRFTKFRKPKTSHLWFDVLSWPGSLLINGDCGCFVFSRIHDMFQFFRGKDPDFGYWAEKLVATDKTDSHEAYNPERFRSKILEWAKEYADSATPEGRGMGENERKSLFEAIELDVLCDLGSQDLDRAKARDFGWEGVHIFQDFWEVDCMEYTPRFVWNCHAIQWAIERYDRMKGMQG